MLEDVSRRVVSLPDSGVEIALLDWGGDGPLALLHHATGYCAGIWDPVARLLGDHYRVIAMDARGHGDSSKPEDPDAYRWPRFGRDLALVAEQLAAEHVDGRVALAIGHSCGGTAILTASAQRPELFERGVLVDPVILPPNLDPTEHANPLAEGARKRRHVWPSREAIREKWSKKEFFAAWDAAAFELYLAEGFGDRADGQVELKCPGFIEAAVFEWSLHFDVWPIAAAVRMPISILWAVRGDFPRSIYEELARRLADAEILDVDTGHLIPMERPDWVAEAALEFAARDRDA